jgi:alanine racemase
LPTGYGDGYSRLLSNKGYVLIKGKRAPIIGRVCMDQMMVDVTDIEGVCIGDEAVLLGESGEESISADDMAKMIGTIGYEIVCNISARVDTYFV